MHPPFSGEKGTQKVREREHTVKKLGLHCLPADEGYSTPHNSYPHPRSSCQGFPASKGTRELLPTRIIHSPFQNTTCGDLPRLWRAASHRVHSHTVPDLCLWLFTHMSCSFNLKLLTYPLAAAATASGTSSTVTADEDDYTVHASDHMQHCGDTCLGCAGFGFHICEVPPGLTMICQGFQTQMSLIWAVS